MNTWAFDTIPSVPKLLAAVSEFLPTARTVCFEIANACPEAEAVYSKHKASENLRPSRDTFSPKTQLQYCVISKSLAADLENVLRHHEIKKVFWHIKAFDDRKLLFAIHDADLGDPVYFSGLIDAAVIQSIGSAINQTPTQLQTGYDWNENHRR
jgi:hypothetical protein